MKNELQITYKGCPITIGRYDFGYTVSINGQAELRPEPTEYKPFPPPIMYGSLKRALDVAYSQIDHAMEMVA